MNVLDAIDHNANGKLTPLEMCAKYLAESSNEEFRGIGLSALNQYEETMNMVLGYREMLEDLSAESIQNGFNRHTTMFIFMVMGRPINYTPPIQNSVIGYIVSNTPYDGDAKVEATRKFGDEVVGVSLFEIRGKIINREYERYLSDYKPVQYRRFLEEWG